VALMLVGIAFAGSADEIASGARIAGIDVGGLTAAKARQKLEKASARVAWVPIEFVVENKRFEVAPAQLGIDIDWTDAVASARHDGDGSELLRGFKRLRVRLFGSDIQPAVEHSDSALTRLLDRISNSVDRPAREPALVLDESKPTVVPGHSGRVLDRKAAAALVIETLASFERGEEVTLPMRVDEPRVHRSDLVRVAGEMRTVVSAPVTLEMSGSRWTISPEEIQKMLVFPHGGERQLSIDSSEKNAFMSALARQLSRPAKNATFAISGRSVHVVPARPGTALDRERTAKAIMRAALSRRHRIAGLVLDATQPARSTEQARSMGVTGLVGSYETSFTGTANRIHNVELVAKLIDDKLIAPGATFSFNQTTGERSAQKGFLTAPQIVNGQLVDALGGGVCQVSTTVFNAAYEAGLDITARTNHALYISHYPLGRDATVSWPSPDLKFRNDTDHWLWLRTFSSSDALLVAIYGTLQHRRVVSQTAPLQMTGAPPVKRVPDPTLVVGKKVVEDPGEASYTTHVRRRVYAADGKLIHDNTWYSNYRSSPKVVRVGTKSKKKKKTTTGTTTTGTTTTGTTTARTTTTTTATTTTETTGTGTATTETTTSDGAAAG
jgi:vancomycin resistance protein YoaR